MTLCQKSIGSHCAKSGMVAANAMNKAFRNGRNMFHLKLPQVPAGRGLAIAGKS